MIKAGHPPQMVGPIAQNVWMVTHIPQIICMSNGKNKRRKKIKGIELDEIMRCELVLLKIYP